MATKEAIHRLNGVFTLIDELFSTRDEFESKYQVLLKEVDWLERRMNSFRQVMLETSSEDRLYGPLTCIKIKELLEKYEEFALKYEEEYGPALEGRREEVRRIEEAEKARALRETISKVEQQRNLTAQEQRNEEARLELERQAERRAAEALRLTEFAKQREKRQNEKKDFIMRRYEADIKRISEIGWRSALKENIIKDAVDIEKESATEDIGPHWCNLELRKRIGRGLYFLRQILGEPDAAYFRVLRCLNPSFLEDFGGCFTNLCMLCASGFKLKDKQSAITEIHDAQQSYALTREDAPKVKNYRDDELFYVLSSHEPSSNEYQVKCVYEFVTGIIDFLKDHSREMPSSALC